MGGNFVDCLWQIAKEGIFDLIVHFHSPVGAVIFHGDGDRGRGGSCIFRDTGNEDFICPGKPSPYPVLKRLSCLRVFCNLGLVIAHHGPAIAAGKFQLNNGAHTVSGNFFRQNGIIQIGEKLCSESTGDGAAIFGVSGENTVQIQITAELFGVKFF